MTVIFRGDSAVSTGGRPLELREAIADLYHSFEDRNWTNMSLDPSQYIGGADFDMSNRRSIVTRARNIARRNPVAKQALLLGAHYTFGSGITVKTLDIADRRFVRPVIERFWADPYNQRTLTSLQSQTERFVELMRDGNLFLVCYVDPATGGCRWVRLDAMRVDDIISDPDDVSFPRWYKVKRSKSRYDFKQGQYDLGRSTTGSEWMYLRDWRYPPRDGDDLPPSGMIGQGMIYHLAINREGKFGVSDLYASDDWLTAHKGFMEDRASLVKALSTIAWVVTRKDTPSGIQQAAQAIRSTWAQQPLAGFDLHPNPAAGATLLQNEGAKREPMKVDTGAGNAAQDEEALLKMAGIGMGVVGTHYLGSTGAHRLATVTAMELPMLKGYEWWQHYWQGAYTDILQHQIDQAILAGVIPGADGTRGDDGLLRARLPDDGSVTVEGSGVIDRTVRVDMPPILVKDLAGVINAVRNLADVLPISVEARKELALVAFGTLGVEDPEGVVARIFGAGDNPILLPANSTKNNVLKVLPDNDTKLPMREEDEPDDDDLPTAVPAWGGDESYGNNGPTGGKVR